MSPQLHLNLTEEEKEGNNRGTFFFYLGSDASAKLKKVKEKRIVTVSRDFKTKILSY